MYVTILGVTEAMDSMEFRGFLSPGFHGWMSFSLLQSSAGGEQGFSRQEVQQHRLDSCRKGSPFSCTETKRMPPWALAMGTFLILSLLASKEDVTIGLYSN